MSAHESPSDGATPADSPGGDHVHPLEMAPHYYGGQAVIEGVMMRGAEHWAVAVRRPAEDIYVETHPIPDFAARHPIIKKPMLRGVYALVDALTIGMKALNISATQSLGEEEEDELPSGAMGASMLLAALIFVGIFIVVPSAGLKLIVGDRLGDGALFHVVESVIRIGIFLAYLSAISLIADIRRVFQYHGAEHKTIAAWEHGEELTPEKVDRYSTLHVRCGTNFLIMVMILALIVYTLAGTLVPAPEAGGLLGKILYHVLLRVVLLPVVAGLAYEGLRLGAAHGDNIVVRALMKPGIWLQLITTKQPERDQIEVAIRAFEAVVPLEHREGRIPDDLPSAVVHGPDDEEPVASAPGDDADILTARAADPAFEDGV